MADGSDFSLRSLAVPIYGPTALFGLSQGAMIPVIIVGALDRGATESTASIIAALVGIGALVSNLPAGIMTNRFGERMSMVTAAFITMVGLALCIVSTDVIVFGIGVLATGVASSVFMLARQSYLTELVPRDRRARAMSLLGGVQRIGAFVGPFVSAVIILWWGTDVVFVFSLVAIVAAGLIAWRVPDIEVRAAQDETGPVTITGLARQHWHVLVTLGTGVLMLSAIRQTRQVVIPLWAHHVGISPSVSAAIYGISGFIEVLVFYPAGVAMDKWGRRWIASGCTFVMGVSFVILPLTHSVPAVIAAAVVMGLGNGIGSGIVNTLGADVAPAYGRPVFLGLWRELADGGSSIGPLILSGVSAVASLEAGVVVSGVVGFAAAVILWRSVREPNRAPQPVE